jgi:ribonuclease P protein subunit RPR2
VRSPVRPLLAIGAALALAAPAHAGNDQAPGVLKKQDPTPVTEVAPAPPVPAPVQQPATAAPQVKVNAKAPLTKGTAKKVARSQPAAAPSTGTTPGQTTRTQRVRTVRRASSRTATPRRATHSTQPAAVAADVTTPTRIPASSSDISEPSRTRSAAAARPRTHTAAVKPVASVRKQPEQSAPLTSISHAADRVIEVIPGAVILALGGLVGLVLLLMLRSWAMERQRGKALAKSYGVTVEALATAIEAKDHCTGGHIERVRRLGLLLAAEIIPREARDPQMAYGFLLHDIGKLAVPDAILRAPGRLSEDQWALMRRHPAEGVRMLASVPFLDRALDVVRHHHERWDGGGYPAGLAGEQIPLWARIFSVVDTLDAITAERPYRQPRSFQDALAEIQSHAGTQFDPAVVGALERLDPAAVEPLLEPTQIVEPQAIALVPLAAA